MFTGIVEKKVKVAASAKEADLLRVTIPKPAGWKLALGQSVNIDGVCSTVVSIHAATFDVQYMPETLAKTTAGRLRPGTIVNLERSLRLQSFVDGHLVQGHVDARAKVVSVPKNKNNRLVQIALPPHLLPLATQHGAIAINGVSLTIARVSGTKITVALIPHTLSHTNLGELRKGDEVNIEMDIFARYCANILLRARFAHAKKRSGPGWAGKKK